MHCKCSLIGLKVNVRVPPPCFYRSSWDSPQPFQELLWNILCPNDPSTCSSLKTILSHCIKAHSKLVSPAQTTLSQWKLLCNRGQIQWGHSSDRGGVVGQRVEDTGYGLVSGGRLSLLSYTGDLLQQGFTFLTGLQTVVKLLISFHVVYMSTIRNTTIISNVFCA